MPKTLVFHVGAAPTASWLVQQQLRRHEDTLRRDGVHFLPSDVLTAHIGSGSELVDDRESFATVVREALQPPDVDVLVASHEGTVGDPFSDGEGGGLYPGAGQALDALARLSEPFRRVIVLSVCPAPDFVESYYLRMIDAGAHNTFDEWLGEVDLTALSWIPLYETLIGAFGRDCVRVLEYGRTDIDEPAFLHSFFDLVGVELPPRATADPPVRRPGLSDRGLRLAIAANPYLTTWAERAALRRFLARRFSNWDYPAPALLSAAQRSELADRYRDEYADLLGQHPVAEAGRTSGSASDGTR